LVLLGDGRAGTAACTGAGDQGVELLHEWRF
jgi:hypothetical protein